MSDDDVRLVHPGQRLVGAPMTYADLAYLVELGAAEVELNRDGALVCVSFPARRRRRRSATRLRNGEPAGREPANATGAETSQSPTTPGVEGVSAHSAPHPYCEPGQCPRCGKEGYHVVITDGALTSTVFVEERTDQGTVAMGPDGVYQEVSALVMHAPSCPKWDGGSCDWRTDAIRIP